MKMKLFIAWSGELSARVARVLHDWIPAVLRPVDPYLSVEDIEKGTRWLPELTHELASTSFGVLCLVPGNVESPWLCFEAGALSASVDGSRLSPFLLGLAPSELRGPLAAFQATVFEREDVLRLLRSINAACGDAALSRVRLERAFERAWPALEAALAPLYVEAVAQRSARPDRLPRTA